MNGEEAIYFQSIRTRGIYKIAQIIEELN